MKQYEYKKIEEKSNFKSSPLRATSEKEPANPVIEARIGSAVWLVTLKGLDGNQIFLQICNLYTI